MTIHDSKLKEWSNSNEIKMTPEKRGKRSDELIKYMSKLPDYLQKPGMGDNLQEKALSVGVLDWDRLERWKHHQQTSVPPVRRDEYPIQGVGNAHNVTHPSRMAKSSSLENQVKLPKHNPVSKSDKKLPSEKYPLEECVQWSKHGRNIIDGNRSPFVIDAGNLKDYVSLSLNFCPQKEFQIEEHKDGERRKHHHKLQQLEDLDIWFDANLHDVDAKSERPWVLPKQDLTYHTEDNIQLRTDEYVTAEARGSTVGINVQCPVPLSDNPYSCSVPYEFQHKNSQDINVASKSIISMDAPKSEGFVLQNSDKGFCEAVPDAASGWNKYNVVSEKCPIADTSNEFDPHELKQDVYAESSSSTFGSQDFDVNNLNSSVQSLEIVPTSKDQHIEKLGYHARLRGSPLMKVLFHMLKAKSLNHLDASCRSKSWRGHPIKDHTLTKDGSRSSISSSNESSLRGAVKKKLNFSGLFEDGHVLQDSMHAVLQVAYQDGLPLLTFKLSTHLDSLAASFGNIYNLENGYECMYTFLSIQGVKRGFVRKHDRKGNTYATDVVGHLRVSATPSTELAGSVSEITHSIEKYVLFDAGLKESNCEALNLMPANELAAIVASNSKQQQDLATFTVIIPSGAHSLPASAGMPPSLIDRWRSGGLCDCGGWDEGCMLMILKNNDPETISSFQACTSMSSCKLNLFLQGGLQERKEAFRLSEFSKGLYSVQYARSMSSLQAFFICVSFLHSQKLIDLSDVHSLKGEAPVKAFWPRERVNTSKKYLDVPSYYFPCPPHSPVGRA